MTTNVIHQLGAVAARPFAIPLPSSVSRMVLPSSFGFTGNELTSITPEVGLANTTIVGSPLRGGTGGYNITEASGGANRVDLDFAEVDVVYPSGEHIMVMYRRSAVPDTQTILLGTSSLSVYAGVGDSGSTSTLTAQGIDVTSYRSNGVEYTGTATRQDLWNAWYDDYDQIRCVAFQDVSGTSLDLQLGVYETGGTFTGEMEILGWAVFDDWSQADTVEDYMILNAQILGRAEYVGGWQLSRSTNLAATDGAITSFDVINVDDNLSLSGPITTVTVPDGVSRVIVGAQTRNGGFAASFFSVAIRRNTTRMFRNAYHAADYNTVITAGSFDVTPGDTIDVQVSTNGSGASDASSTTFWGKFYA